MAKRHPEEKTALISAKPVRTAPPDPKVWVVHDPSPTAEAEDFEFDCFYETTLNQLPNLVAGTGITTWRTERTTIHLDEAAARADLAMRRANFYPTQTD